MAAESPEPRHVLFQHLKEQLPSSAQAFVENNANPAKKAIVKYENSFALATTGICPLAVILGVVTNPLAVILGVVTNPLAVILGLDPRIHFFKKDIFYLIKLCLVIVVILGKGISQNL